MSKEKRNLQKFDPDSIRRIELAFEQETQAVDLIELFDSEGKSVAKVGGAYKVGERHEIELEKGERICGITSMASCSKRVHRNFQFVICKE